MKSGKRRSAIRIALGKTVHRARFLVLGLVLTIAGSIALVLLPPLALERIVNRLTEGLPVLVPLALLYFALLAISGLFDAAKETLVTIFGQRVTRMVRETMCEKLSRMSAAYFTKTDPGVTVSRFVNDVDTVDTLFSAGIISMFVDACKVLSIVAMIFVKSRGLGLLMLVVTPLLFLFTRIVQKRMLTAQLANRVAVGKVNNHVPETIRNIRMVHTFHKEGWMRGRYDGFIQECYRAMEKSNFYDAIYSPTILIQSAIIIAVMMVLSAIGGSMQTLFGMSIGTAVAIIAYVGKVFDPLESIGMEIQSIQSAIAGVRRIGEFLDEPDRAPVDTSLKTAALLKSGEACIAFEGVGFGYAPQELVLQNRSFVIHTGEHVTLTGRTGSGKSTIFKLILGLYRPDEGRVRVYGQDAALIPDEEKRTLFGYVEQSFRMVPGTIADQITLFDPQITRAQAEDAAHLVGLHAGIEKLEQGYDTLCSEDLFSQGQWQLLSIARAVAANPAVLLLDEITANLDSETEQAVLAALERASANRSMLSISHRLYEQAGGRCISLDEVG